MPDDQPAPRYLDHAPPSIVEFDGYDDAPATPPDLLDGRYDQAALMREKTVRGQFVRDVLAAQRLSPADKAQILLVGLLALDGADDLEVR